MPSRRRHGRLRAAALPTRRLPVGTPRLFTLQSPSSSPPDHRGESAAQQSSSDGHSPPVIQSQTSSSPKASLPMEPPDSSTTVPSLSTAEAKLQRQMRRNEEVDLPPSSLASDKRRAPLGPRVKGKQWMPFDFTADSAPSSRSATPIDPTQHLAWTASANALRPASREPSVCRSVSALSHHTSEDHSDKEYTGMNGGFQLYKPRRGRKGAGGLSVCSDEKPDERQTTVEASYDTRATYEVFGNALPSQEFLEQNVGYKDGQVQFLQHPNGDVSAHQWSQLRYQWENIGQFSNIRKKVEGQLAADHLNGETASQTLLQNTLAYFRTIAKQREAKAMGLPFGPKEIQAILPLQHVELSATVKPTENPAHQSGSSSLEASHNGQAGNLAPSDNQTSTAVTHDSKADRSFTSESSATTVRPTLPSLRHEDPFTASSQRMPLFYGGQQPAPLRVPTGPALRYSRQNSPGLNYDYHFPPSAYGTRAMHLAPHGSRMPTRPYYGNQALPWQQEQNGNGHIANTQSPRPYWNPMANFEPGQGSHGQAVVSPPGLADGVPGSCSRHVSPFNGNHTDRLDQLVKIGDAAKERSLSQANIRTVLYDPLQNPPKGDQQNGEPVREAQKQQESPYASRTVHNRTPPRTDMFGPMLPRPFDAFGGQGLQPSSSPEHGVSESILKDSSPDTMWDKRPYEHSTPNFAVREAQVALSNDFRNISDQTSQSQTFASSVNATSQTPDCSYEEDLNIWYNSSSRLARHDDVFRLIKAAANATPGSPSPRTPATYHSSAHQLPAAASQAPTPKPSRWSETFTRLMIPVQETIASYVQGPEGRRRDYFTPWSAPPEWAIDRDIGANNSFYDEDWGRPPNRIGRDRRYRHMPVVPLVPGPVGGGGAAGAGFAQYASAGWMEHGTPGGDMGREGGAVGGGRLDRRFQFGGRF